MKSQDINDLLLSLQANMLNFALILTSSRKAADALLQQTTMRALADSDAYDGTESQFKSWVFGIMRTLADDCRERHSAYGPRIRVEGMAVASDVPEGCVAMECLCAALAGMEPGLREVWSMHLQGYTCLEISRMTGMAVSRVRKNLKCDWRRFEERLASI